MKHANSILNFFRSQGKIASQTAPSREELIEIGFVGEKLDNFYKQADAFGRQAFVSFLKHAERVEQLDHGTTKREDEMVTGGQVHTDYEEKDVLSQKAQAAMDKVQELLDINELEDTDGYGAGATLSHTDVTNASNDAGTTEARDQMKVGSQRAKVHDLLKRLGM